ncbi:hypothetical protein BVX98_07340 [bacterium F11]|nr:hypothetical protein BVX98_07340 [bacterium F11]
MLFNNNGKVGEGVRPAPSLILSGGPIESEYANPPIILDIFNKPLDVVIRLGTERSGKEPAVIEPSYPVGLKTIVGWTEITAIPEPMKILHVWNFKGQSKGAMVFNIKPPSFAVSSQLSLYGQVGSWKFVVKNEHGQILARKEFEVTDVKNTVVLNTET